MADVGGEIGAVGQVVADHVLGLGSHLAVDREGGLRRRARIHAVVNRVHVHARAQLVVDLLLVALTLEHIQTLVGCVARHEGVVAPHAIVGIGIVFHDLVDVAAGLVHIHTGDAAYTDAQLVVGDIGTGVVIHEAKEVVTAETLVLDIAVIALIGQQVGRMLTHKLAVVERARAEQQQVLELDAVTVIEHLAQQAVGHSVARAAGELVEHLLLSHHGHVDAVNGTMQVG